VECIERLAYIIEASVSTHLWSPIIVGRNGPQIANLMFADDLVLFAEAEVGQAHAVMECLNRFCKASGQSISRAKSRVYFSKNTELLIRETISEVLGMETTDDLCHYLGVPVLHGRTSRTHFQCLLDRVSKRLVGWKTQCLSLAGRATLIHSTVSTIPAYVMQTTRLPRSVCDEIDKTVRRFFWGGTSSQRRVYLLSW